MEKSSRAWTEFVTDPLNIPKRLLALDTLWPGAERIILSVFQHKRTVVQAGHAMSKDWAAGILILQWLFTYYGRSKVIVTAPITRQVKEIVFRELEKQYVRFLEMYPNQGFRRDWLTTNKLDFGPECFALGFTTRESEDMIGKFQGFHSSNLLVILTEAQDIPSQIYKQVRGLVTSANSRILEIGNPLYEFGNFYDHCTDPKYGFNVIHLSCFDSPNVIVKKEVIPGMVTWEYIEEMQRVCGPDFEDDPEYQARVLGEFPQNSKHAWIPLVKIKEAVNRRFSDDDDITVAGVDTAGEGDDETVHCVLRGRVQVRQDCFRKVLTPETVGWIRQLVESDGIQAAAIDEGYNKGISGWLDYENIHARIVSVNFGKESPHSKFENLGTYMWHCLREAFMAGDISIIEDPVLVSQLASRRVEPTPRGKLRLVSKKKEGRKSPDRADALALAWHMRMLMMSQDSMFGGAENESSRLHETVGRTSSVRDEDLAREMIGSAASETESLGL